MTSIEKELKKIACIEKLTLYINVTAFIVVCFGSVTENYSILYSFIEAIFLMTLSTLLILSLFNDKTDKLIEYKLNVLKAIVYLILLMFVIFHIFLFTLQL